MNHSKNSRFYGYLKLVSLSRTHPVLNNGAYSLSTSTTYQEASCNQSWSANVFLLSWCRETYKVNLFSNTKQDHKISTQVIWQASSRNTLRPWWGQVGSCLRGPGFDSSQLQAFSIITWQLFSVSQIRKRNWKGACGDISLGQNRGKKETML